MPPVIYKSVDGVRSLIHKTIAGFEWGNCGGSATKATEKEPLKITYSCEWTGEKLHKIWSESCSKLPVAIERDWSALHRHKKERWNELAKVINTNILWI